MDRNAMDANNSFITAVGSLAEMCWIFFNTLIQCGFETDEAMTLTTIFLKETISKEA